MPRFPLVHLFPDCDRKPVQKETTTRRRRNNEDDVGGGSQDEDDKENGMKTNEKKEDIHTRTTRSLASDRPTERPTDRRRHNEENYLEFLLSVPFLFLDLSPLASSFFSLPLLHPCLREPSVSPKTTCAALRRAVACGGNQAEPPLK